MEQGETNRREKPDEIEEEKGRSTNGEKWVCDSSVDYKGRIPLRAFTGVWRASLFIITIEFTERLSYFGIATNLISYLTSEIHQDIKTAAKNVNYWAGVTTLMPLVGGFLADAYTGRFTMVLLSSLIYLMGLSLLTMSQYIPSLSPCSHSDSCMKPRRIHEVIFFLALYCMSLGSGGLKPCLESFGADQFDDDHPQERKQKMSYFNWWNFVLCSGLVLGVTVIVYIQDHAGWGPGSLVLALIMTISIITFFMGRRFYRYRACEGSPLTPIAQVLAAAMRKRKLKLHPAVTDGRAPPFFETEDPKGRLLHHTDRLRCLDKAAVMDEKDKVAPEGKHNPWRLATLTKVEETKLLLNMIPIWLTSLTFGVNVAHTSTFFVILVNSDPTHVHPLPI